MYVIVKTGGKQYKVTPGDITAVEKIDVEAGSKVELEARSEERRVGKECRL